MEAEEMTTELSEVRRELTDEVNQRRKVLKPIEQAIRALKDPHNNAVALFEAGAALESAPEELELPEGASELFNELRALADTHLSELEFTFVRDLREAFQEIGITLAGEPNALVAELFVIKPDIRRKQVEMTLSR